MEGKKFGSSLKLPNRPRSAPGRTHRQGAILCLLETLHCVGLTMRLPGRVRKGIIRRPRLRGHAQWDTILTALAMEEWKDLVGCSYRGLYSKFSFHLCQGQPTPVEWLSLPSLFILRLLCHIYVTFKVMGATCVCSGTVEQSWPELGMGGEKGRRSVTLPHLMPSPCAWKERPTGQAQV